MALSAPIRTGVLQKKHPKFRKYNDRFLVLRSNALDYYKGNHADIEHEEPRGSIPLEVVQRVEVISQPCVGVELDAGGTVFVFRANSERDAQEWAEASESRHTPAPD